MITRDAENIATQSRSPWFVALGIVTTIFVISALMLLYYLTPGGGDLFAEELSPTASTANVDLTVGKVPFAIPANYIGYASARRGGARRRVEMYARLPDLDGWSVWQADRFHDNSADSPILHFSLEADPYAMAEAERLRRVYSDYVTNLTGRPEKYGLEQLTFRRDSGYQGRDMFIGETENGKVVLICEQLSAKVTSPNCLRQEFIAPGVSLRYRFKRDLLTDWKSIAEHTDALIAHFREAAANRASKGK